MAVLVSAAAGSPPSTTPLAVAPPGIGRSRPSASVCLLRRRLNLRRLAGKAESVRVTGSGDVIGRESGEHKLSNFGKLPK